MSTKTVDSHQARKYWRDTLDTVQTGEADVVITRYNKPVVAVVPYEDYMAVQEELHRRRAIRHGHRRAKIEAIVTMLASERVLSEEWDTPEEDEAWADL